MEGYVDRAGLVQQIPQGIPPDRLIAYTNEAEAQEALEGGTITAFTVIPEDYIETGELIYVHPEANPIVPKGQPWVMRWILLVNLVEGDLERAARLWEPMEVEAIDAAPELPQDAAEEEEDSPARFTIPYATTILLYVVIMLSASLLLSSVNDEKKNRVMEILMQSLHPRQLLTGKIIGLGLAGLLQAAIWLGTSYFLIRLGRQPLDIPSSIQLPLSILGWAMAFFLLGYVVYASLMAALGALVPNIKEASQATFVIIVPMIIPMALSSILIENAHGTLAVVLSLFPLSAPVAMMLRLTVGGVPLWQPALAMALMALTAVFIVRAVARMFHAQALLSGQPFSVRRYFAALVGRAREE